MDGFLKRFGQESTWRGIVTVLAAFGVMIEPAKADAIIAAALAIVGAINVLKGD